MSSFLTPRWYSPFSVSSMKFISSWCTLLKTMVLFWIRLSLMSGVIRGEQSAMNTCCSVPGSCPGTVAKCPFTCITYERKKNIEHEIIYSHDLFLHNICSFSNNAALQPSNLIRSTCYDLTSSDVQTSHIQLNYTTWVSLHFLKMLLFAFKCSTGARM